MDISLAMNHHLANIFILVHWMKLRSNIIQFIEFELFRTEFQNKDFIQEITVNGFISKKNNEFKYDFLLSEVSMFTTPPVKDCLKIIVPKNIR